MSVKLVHLVFLLEHIFIAKSTILFYQAAAKPLYYKGGEYKYWTTVSHTFSNTVTLNT